MSISESDFKRLEIRVNEIYEWMCLTQTKTMEKLIESMERQRKMLKELEGRVNNIDE